jgi:hypothetical protein
LGGISFDAAGDGVSVSADEEAFLFFFFLDEEEDDSFLPLPLPTLPEVAVGDDTEEAVCRPISGSQLEGGGQHRQVPHEGQSPFFHERWASQGMDITATNVPPAWSGWAWGRSGRRGPWALGRGQKKASPNFCPSSVLAPIILFSDHQAGRVGWAGWAGGSNIHM